MLPSRIWGRSTLRNRLGTSLSLTSRSSTRGSAKTRRKDSRQQKHKESGRLTILVKDKAVRPICRLQTRGRRWSGICRTYRSRSMQIKLKRPSSCQDSISRRLSRRRRSLGASTTHKTTKKWTKLTRRRSLRHTKRIYSRCCIGRERWII